MVIPFAPECHEMIVACDQEMIHEMDAHDEHGLEAMFGRTKEIAMRLALIVARSKGESRVSPESLQWAIDYATFYARRTTLALRRSVADSPFEAACKAVYSLIERSGLKGCTEREIARGCRPFAGMEPRKRRDIMEALAVDRGVRVRVEGKRISWISTDE